MFVACWLKNDSTEFDENFKNCFKRYQKSLESSLNWGSKIYQVL